MSPVRIESERFKVKPRFLLNGKLVGVAAAVAGVALVYVLLKSEPRSATGTNNSHVAAAASASSHPPASVDLSTSQLNSIKVAPVSTYLFPVEKDAVGNISLADDLSVDVFPNYQGKLIKALMELGDHVQQGQPLYTIDSPDLIQAESALIGAAAQLELTTKELARAKSLNGPNGVSEREVEQAVSDQQTAEGALKAARDTVRVFGKSDADIDRIIVSRKIDPVLVVPSPITGQVTTFNAPPGLFVQPGNAPAPYTVANLTVKWLLADVSESDIPAFHPGQSLEVKVTAYPNRVFKGRISKIYENVDPNTHRATVRAEISDPKNELRPGMLATFVIRVQAPVKSTALPADGVVRESDGSMTAWVTTDRRHFVQRVIKTGLRTDGQVQVLDGLQQGELAVTDGAVFLSNMLEAPPSD
jgi:cobalt-zinc-cadmium efflux system membrane fusion protein